MKNEGYVKIFRRMIDTSFYKNPKMTHFAVHCLLRANHKPTKVLFNGQELELQKGEFISGLYALKKETGLSIQSIRTCSKSLRTIGFLTSKSTNQFTIYRVEKYDFYQFSNGKLTNKATNHQQTDNKRITTDNNDKNDNNEKKEAKGTHLDFVKLTPTEHTKLLTDYGQYNTDKYIKALNGHIGSKGDKYKSHYFTIINWLSRDEVKKEFRRKPMTAEDHKRIVGIT